MRHTSTNIFLLFALIAGGCGEVAIAPYLARPDIRLDERTVPLPFVLAFHNSGDETAMIKSVSVGVLQKTLISRTGDDIPSGFDYRVEYKEGHPMQIGAGHDGVACGFLRWTLPEDAPPMLAIVRCSFEVDFGEWEVSTEPITLVLQSCEGVLESLGEEDSVVARDQAAKLVETLSAFPGRKSEGFKELLRQLEATATSPAPAQDSTP
ncbi:MAG: hypothetical protein H0T51_06195 [Pirellulales bacterium]|nr:hypothetical protein [Pirellulales bacterium]